MTHVGAWGKQIAREERIHPPVYPGEVLKQEWLEPLGMSVEGLAEALRVDRREIHGVVNGERAMIAATALRLARWSGMRPEFWLGLQARYDLEVEKDRGEGLSFRGVFGEEL